MATSSVSSSGGIDVNTIVTQLMTIERQPIAKLNTKGTSYKAKITALGLIQSKVASFQSAVKSLLGSGSANSLLTYKATSSDSNALSASASNTAVAGVYSLEVTKLAQSQKLVAAGQTSSSAAIGDGTATTVTFDFGTISGGTLTNGVYSGATFNSNGSGAKSITIDGANNTLTGIRDAINAAKIGVSATIVNDGSGTPYRLALSSDSSGVSNSIKISTSGGDGTIDALLAYDPGGGAAAQHLSQTAAAQNAEFKVNGVAISKSSNIVSDAIDGVSLTLGKETTAPVTLTVVADTSAVTDKVNAFVKAYNDLYSSLKNSSAYKSGSALEGDAMLRSLQTQMRSIAGAAVSGGSLSNLYEVGISFQATGVMQLDSAKLSSAMSADFNGVANLFNSATGYATQYDALTTAALAVDGTFATKTNGFNQSIKSIDAQISTLEVRMKNLEKQYRTTYSNLNVMLSSMGKTSAYIAQQLG